METIRPKRMDKDIRLQVFERDGYVCRYCGDARGPFHADHVYPYVKGGETSLENMVTACEHCNRRKHDAVGEWPKPIGYFRKRHSPGITMVTMLGVFLMMYGVLNFRDGFGLGEIAFLVGVGVSLLSMAHNLLRQ